MEASRNSGLVYQIAERLSKPFWYKPHMMSELAESSTVRISLSAARPVPIMSPSCLVRRPCDVGAGGVRGRA
jgi:hypothetical protein